ncbi:CRISPR-associated endonuclease Cas6 [uncultured Thiodictyon sp.]|uniref:CRISPR-associated endonuclease Cas6 n=1 Tax=uncultured Thiodictyon sp. TaxID=1846217 RepID=UPI0025F46CB0|nr:CRISPR-associated endonuclease Cas6 [uncultured Thiodictyon sp.]
MHLLATIPLTQVELRWDRELAGGPEQRTKQLRGALANAFRGDDLFHQHDLLTGKALYRYPRVQYRWRRGRGLVVGWGQAADRLLNLPWLELNLLLGETPVVVSDAALTLNQGHFGVGDHLGYYRLETPVLLFNQENYRRYQAMTATQQRSERERLLVANLLTALRGLDVTFPERLYATLGEPQTCTCHYKGEKLLGLTGELATNAALPSGFSFGHAVSHGYGWLTL